MTDRLLIHGNFLGLPICVQPTCDFVDAVVESATAPPTGEPLRIAYLNAWTTVMAYRSLAFAQLLSDHMQILYADGMGVVWAARRHGAMVPERINAADFIVAFLARCARRGLRVYLLGGQEGVASGAARVWKQSVPDLIISGEGCGYWKSAAEVAQAVRNSQSDILILGLGSPQQEEFARDYGAETGARVIWCVGAMMEYHAGRTARAPEWMRKAGLEWLFRLMVEPRRLWHRYLVGNAMFLWLTIRGRPLVDRSKQS